MGASFSIYAQDDTIYRKYGWVVDTPDQRDHHYGFIQYASALSADALFFNSSFNLENFIEGSSKFLKSMRDFRELETISTIRKKSFVLFSPNTL